MIGDRLYKPCIKIKIVIQNTIKNLFYINLDETYNYTNYIINIINIPTFRTFSFNQILQNEKQKERKEKKTIE